MPLMLRFIIPIRLAILTFLTLALPVSAGAGAPTETVTQLQSSLISTMKSGDHLNYEGRFKKLHPIIDQAHDFSSISKVVTGKFWSSLSPDQKTTFVRVFTDLSVSMYADRFNSYNGETFTVLSEKDLPRGNRKLVDTRFTKSDGEEVRFLYMLHQVGGQWKILNITVNGVSDLALKRAEYGGILKKNDGFEELLRTLHAQIDKNAHGQ